MNLTKIAIAVARLENNRASAPYSRAGTPRPVAKYATPAIRCWNLESAPSTRRHEEINLPGDDLNPASLARLARLKTLALGCGRAEVAKAPPADTFEAEKKIPMSFSPPRFKTLKKGPRAGQTVEEKWMLRLVTRTVTNGTVTFTSTAVLKKDGFKLPQSAQGRSFVTLAADFRLRWPDQATALVAFLSFRDTVGA